MKTYINCTPKQLIDEIRTASFMSDAEIAKACAMTQSTINRLRSGVLFDTSSANWKSLVDLHGQKVHKKKKLA